MTLRSTASLGLLMAMGLGNISPERYYATPAHRFSTRKTFKANKRKAARKNAKRKGR